MYFDTLGLCDFYPMKDRVSAKILNNVQFNELLGRLCNIGLSRFKWNGLPKTCNERALEMQLFFFGKALFFEDKEKGFMNTQVELPGPFNIYYESIERVAYGWNYHVTYNETNSVIIRANKTMTPDYLIVWTYAPKITNALRAIDVHMETLKRPFIIVCEDREKKSVRAALEKITDNEIAIVGRSFAQNNIEVMSMASTSYLSEFWSSAKNYMNQCLNGLGVDNNFTEKKERLVVSESVGESNSVRHSLESELEMRQQACDEINRMFGLNVSVEANQIEVFPYELMPMMQGNMGGELNDLPGNRVE